MKYGARATLHFLSKFAELGVTQFAVRAVWKQGKTSKRRAYDLGMWNLLDFDSKTFERQLLRAEALSEEGYCIFGRPAGPIGQHFRLIDDLPHSLAVCQKLFPGLTSYLESSLNNCQAWAYLPGPDDDVARHQIAQFLAEIYVSDAGATTGVQIGRLPFPNHKPGRNGFQPLAFVSAELKPLYTPQETADILKHTEDRSISYKRPKTPMFGSSANSGQSTQDWAIAMKIVEMRKGDCTPEWHLSRFLGQTAVGRVLSQKTEKYTDYAYRTVTKAREAWARKNKKSILTYPVGQPPPIGYRGQQVIQGNDTLTLSDINGLSSKRSQPNVDNSQDDFEDAEFEPRYEGLPTYIDPTGRYS